MGRAGRLGRGAAVRGGGRCPGRRFDTAVVEYLRSGKAAGVVTPDSSDREPETFRVVAE